MMQPPNGRPVGQSSAQDKGQSLRQQAPPAHEWTKASFSEFAVDNRNLGPAPPAHQWTKTSFSEFAVDATAIEPTLNLTVKGRPPARACPKCSYSARFAYNIRRHINTVHSDARPHRCAYCLLAYKTAYALKSHTITKHTWAYKYHCPKCGKGCLTPSKVQQHLRQRSCTICATVTPYGQCHPYRGLTICPECLPLVCNEGMPATEIVICYYQ